MDLITIKNYAVLIILAIFCGIIICRYAKKHLTKAGNILIRLYCAFYYGALIYGAINGTLFPIR